MRNVLAVLLAAAAALCGASAWGGFLMDRTLTQPETVKSTVGPMIHDKGVQDMIATQVRDQVVRHLPGGVIQEKSKPVVDKAAKHATTAVLEDDDVEAAWLEVLDRTRAGYTKQVRSGADDAGHFVMVLDPVADLVAEHVSQAMDKVGLKVVPNVSVKWRLTQDLSDVSPLISMGTPALGLMVKQSAHWLIYGLVGLGCLALAFLSAKRRSVVLCTAGFVALAAGLVGAGASSMINGAMNSSSNTVLRSIGQVLTDQISAASWPVVIVGGVVLVLGIILMAVTGARKKRREADMAFDWDGE